MVFRKVPVYLDKEYDFGTDVFAKWEVVPEYVVPFFFYAKRKNRQRNKILWYNPPFSENVSTNTKSAFLKKWEK